MVTDRFGTAILVMILSHLYPAFKFPCMLMIILDMVSHWLRVTASLLIGQGHKNIKNSPLLEIYYNNRIFLGVVCACNELFYIFSYMNYFFPNSPVPVLGLDFFSTGMIVCFPVFLWKQLLNIIQLRYSAIEIVEWEWEHEHQDRNGNGKKSQ
jgi:CDP-diacylglycerol--inositol 3-phosphatidyltransferase